MDHLADVSFNYEKVPGEIFVMLSFILQWLPSYVTRPGHIRVVVVYLVGGGDYRYVMRV